VIATVDPACHGRSMRRPSSSSSRRPVFGLALTLMLAATSATVGCSGTRAYLDWRPGLHANDFDGLYELSRSDYDEFSERGEPNTVFDRPSGLADAQTGPMLEEIGLRMASEGAQADPKGYALVGARVVEGDPELSLLSGVDEPWTGPVDWLAVSSDHQWAAARSGSKLSVVVGAASTGIEMGSLLGKDAAGYHMIMLVEDGELTVFALPRFGAALDAAIAANEPGYVFGFRPQPGAREAWEVSVARVSVRM